MREMFTDEMTRWELFGSWGVVALRGGGVDSCRWNNTSHVKIAIGFSPLFFNKSNHIIYKLIQRMLLNA